jgi:hypothetical protein
VGVRKRIISYKEYIADTSIDRVIGDALPTVIAAITHARTHTQRDILLTALNGTYVRNAFVFLVFWLGEGVGDT